jgi:hypothetical protein
MAMLRRVREALLKLDLDKDQQARADALLSEAQKKIEPLLAAARDGDADARQQVQQAFGAVPRGLSEILTPDQMQRLRQEVGQGGAGGGPNRPASTRPFAPLTKEELAALKPLTELGAVQYKGFAGGLYPNGSNARPPAHDAAGIALAHRVVPLDSAGKPEVGGRIVLLSIGMSNTTMEFSTFKKLADADPRKNPRLTIVDGAQGGQTAARIQDPSGGAGRNFWDAVDRRLQAAAVTREQVQVVWIKEADAGPTDPFPGHARTLQKELVNVVHVIHDRFPNVKLCFLSSRTYGGFATTPLNPEPYAFETGFSVKWLIEQQLNGDAAVNFDPARGDVKSPWLAWGPYLWAAGATPRAADGFTYEVADVVPGDRTHPSESGRQKVAKLLMDFFTTDTATTPWFASGH